MDSLHIDTGIKRIAINDDMNRVIEFNPKDVVFAEKFYALMGELDTKEAEYKQRSMEIDSNGEVDKNGIPLNAGASLELMKDACMYIRDRIDYVFGVGTSQKVFEDANTLDMFAQFFDGITPFVQTARKDKIEKYTNGKVKRVMK